MRTRPIGEHGKSLSGLRVLVVEDDYFIADEMCATLREHGAEIVGPAPDVERGMQLLESDEIDCAVLDINLQGSFAFGIASELRPARHPCHFCDRLCRIGAAS